MGFRWGAVMATSTIVRCRTGERSPVNGVWKFAGYLDGTFVPRVHPAEERITLRYGETFPPIRSANKGCWWDLVQKI